MFVKINRAWLSKEFLVPVILVVLSSCERNDYELFDPDEAGSFTLYTTAEGLPGNRVTDIILDSRKNLWFTSPGHGTFKYTDGIITSYQAATSQILNDAVNCVAETTDGRILFGTDSGLSVLGINNVWSSYLDPVNFLLISTVRVSSNNSIWLGTQSKGLFVNTGSGFTKFLSDPYETINAIEEDKTGNIFIATNNGLVKYNGTSLSYMSLADGLPSKLVTSVRSDSRERVWIGTNGGKVASWLDRNGLHQLNLMAGTDSVVIKDILEDSRGNIWFATDGHGVIMYDGVLPRSFREFNGFPENKVNCIEEDDKGNLWFGLNSKGVVKYSLPVDNR